MAAVSVNVSNVELVWYLVFGRNVGASVDDEFVGEGVSGNDGWAKLKVEDAFYSEKEISVGKDVKI